MKNIQECKFCNLDKSKYYNTILDSTDNFIVIPSIGSLVDGYVLIVSKKHYYNMLEIDLKSQEEYYNLINKYRETFKKIYNKYPIVFEHGSSIYDESSASSIVHAHTHIVNHNFKNEKHLIYEMNFRDFNILSNNNDVSKSYIMYISPNNKSFITYEFISKSQLMRFYIAKDLDLNYYDWKSYSFNKNIKSTINKIKTIK